MTLNYINKVGKTYLVRLGWVNGSPKYIQRFRIKNYNTEEEALEQARKYRDRILKRINLQKNGRSFTPQKNNKTGYPGIYFCYEIKNQKTYHKYRCFFVDEGKRKNLTFSCEKHGTENALNLAILSRKMKRRASYKDLKKWRKQHARLSETS